jgi:hypothetical protein
MLWYGVRRSGAFVSRLCDGGWGGAVLEIMWCYGRMVRERLIGGVVVDGRCQGKDMVWVSCFPGVVCR